MPITREAGFAAGARARPPRRSVSLLICISGRRVSFWPAAERETQMVDDGPQPGRAAGARGEYVKNEPPGEDHSRAAVLSAPKPPHRELDVDASTGGRKVQKRSLVPAVHPPRRLPAIRTDRPDLPRARDGRDSTVIHPHLPDDRTRRRLHRRRSAPTRPTRSVSRETENTPRHRASVPKVSHSHCCAPIHPRPSRAAAHGREGFRWLVHVGRPGERSRDQMIGVRRPSPPRCARRLSTTSRPIARRVLVVALP